MKTIGQYLSSARKEQRMSISELSEKTKIRREFLLAIEKEYWKALPEFPVVTGFVKSIADAVGMDKYQAVATLRRDYPPAEKTKTKDRLRPKPELSKEFRLTPKFTFLLGVGVIIFGIGAYLVAQYISFTRPPMLTVDSPTDGQVVLEKELEVVGNTDPDTTVIVNTQPALLDDEGRFHTVIEITKDTKEVKVTATSRASKVTTITRTIKPEFGN